MCEFCDESGELIENENDKGLLGLSFSKFGEFADEIEKFVRNRSEAGLLTTTRMIQGKFGTWITVDGRFTETEVLIEKILKLSIISRIAGSNVFSSRGRERELLNKFPQLMDKNEDF